MATYVPPRSGAATTTSAQAHPPDCSCLACVGLACLERPRYFAGELLTEAELTSEQSYLLAKSRLHNRYLHGWGVVCGLQVCCSDCAGWIHIAQGYAIDPCGNDIVLCVDQDFNLLDHIHACQRQTVRQRPGCAPITYGPNGNCQDVEETWCVTLAYDEQQARPTTALRQSQPGRPGCGCGSGTSGTQNTRRGSSRNGTSAGCGCGAQTKGASTALTQSMTQSGAGTTLGQCEPTRIFEGFRLDVCRADESTCPTISFERGKGLLGLLQGLAPQDSLLARIIDCVTKVTNLLNNRLTNDARLALLPILFYTNDAAGRSSYAEPGALNDAYCRLYRAIRALFLEDPANTRCALVATLNKIDCPPPGRQDTGETYAAVIREPLYNLVGLLVQYLLDCICEDLLPPVPTPPCDDRIILACVTVKGDQIVRICNFSCRQYVGAFPSVSYWLSLVPIIPVLWALITQLCCRPDLVRAQSPLVNDFAALLDDLDPTGSVRAAIYDGNFALPQRYAGGLGVLLGRLNASQLAAALAPTGTNLALTVNQPIEKAQEQLTAAGVQYQTVEVRSRDEAVQLSTLIAPPFAARGQTVMLYTLGGTVVGFGPAPAVPAAATLATNVNVETLRAELGALRAEVQELRAAMPQQPQG